jgi:hypothetical protein
VRAQRNLRIAVLAGLLSLVPLAAFVGPAAADPPIGPAPPTSNTVTLTASPVTGLDAGQAVTFTVTTSGTARLVGNLTAHLCKHALTGYGTSNFGYSGSQADRCIYSSGIVSGGLKSADYEKTFGPYSGGESTSGPLTLHAGTGTVTWGNASGYGPFTLTANSNNPVDLVIQVNLSGDDTPTTYFIQPLNFAALTVPGAPTAVKASPGSASAVVSYAKPASTGHTTLTGYVVTPFKGTVAQPAQTFNNTALSQTVTGLTNATAYTFKVAAKNSVGTGAQSVASAAIVVGAPKAPTGVKAASGSTTTTTGPITVTYTAGANNGAAISKFTATCTSSNSGVTRSAVRTASTAGPITVTGATTAKLYTCTVTATNARGTSPKSAASGAITVGAPAQPAKPTVAKVASGQLRVTFVKPAANGAAISSITAACTSSNGGVAGSKAGTASPLTVTGLTAFKTYTCTVKATNSRGTGPASVASDPINA